MSIKKYINTAEVAKLTGLQQDDIRNLAKTNVLPSHKNRRGHYRFNVDAVEKYFGIVIDNLEQVDEPSVLTANLSKESVIDYSKSSLPSNDTRLIINENHYQEVIERICAAKSSVKIMTANFKRFRLKPTGSQGENYNDGTPFIKYLMAKAIQGVSVQVICSMPSSSFRDEWKEFYQQMNPKLFEYMFCERNHAKVVIVDDQMAYVGSANITPAGIGQGVFTPGNFEVGILTKNPEIVSSVTTLFYTIWNKAHCDKCHRADMCNAKKLI